jgi:hypothetical protein
MVYRGKIENGKVLLMDPNALPNGTEVEIRPVTKPRRSGKSKKNSRNLAQRLAPFIGRAKDLPPDMSVNLDHYLYGLPRRK